jgi:hypothetical protein
MAEDDAPHYSGPVDIRTLSPEALDEYIAGAQAYAEERRQNPPKTEQQLFEEKVAERQTQREVEANLAREAAAKSAWQSFDEARQPGGLFANLSPAQAAQIEAELLVAHGERPAPPDPYQLAAEMVEKRFEVAFTMFEANLPALSQRLDAINPKDVATKIEQVRRALGEEILAQRGQFNGRHSSDRQVSQALALGAREHARLLEQAKAGIEPQNWNDVIGADARALKAFASHGRNYANYEAALAALPRRKS